MQKNAYKYFTFFRDKTHPYTKYPRDRRKVTY